MGASEVQLIIKRFKNAKIFNELLVYRCSALKNTGTCPGSYKTPSTATPSLTPVRLFCPAPYLRKSSEKEHRRAPASPDPTLCRLWSTALQWEVSGRQSRWTNQKLRRTTTSCGKPEAIPVSIISKALFPLKLPILFSSHPQQPNPLSLAPLPSNHAPFSSSFSLDSPDP